LRNYELKQKAEKYVIPTNDLVVKVRLRQLGEPAILFGEDKGLRRERLREAI
jgi:U4/U6 small nuclear ribonucleoprotein PRP4